MSRECLIRLLARPGAWLLVMFTISSCTSPCFEVIKGPPRVSNSKQAVTDDSGLSAGVVGHLEREGLLSLYGDDPRTAIAGVAKSEGRFPATLRLLALLEMSVVQGDRLSEKQPMVALGHYLDALKLTQDGTEVRNDDVRNLNQRAISGLVETVRSSPVVSKSGQDVSGVLGSHRLKIAGGERYLSPYQFDLLVPSDNLVLNGLELREVRQEGIGLAMLGKEGLSHRQLLENPFVTQGGFCYPINARVEFSGRTASLVLQDLMLGASAKVKGKAVPLEANFTSAIAGYFDEKKPEYSGFLAMLRPGNYESRQGLFIIEPIREDKIPLIMVHGLQSKAMTWVHLANRLRADPLIRERYQIVLFNYPTGNPVAKNAADLREALSDFQQVHDPNRTNPYFKRSVIVGHSMGGVISNMQIRDSGSQLYKALVKEDLDDLKLENQVEDEVERRLFFPSNPNIERAVLIAAPLRGTEFASNFLGRLGSALIRLPFDLTERALAEIQNLNVLVGGETVKRFTTSRNSITSLQANDPVLLEVLKLPVRKGVTIHSIVGQANEDDPTSEGTDRLVPYSSSHLAEAESEKIVLDANHVSILKNDETLAELLRILRKHVGVSER